MSWAYFGERWNDFKTAPGRGHEFRVARSGRLSLLQHLQSVPVFRIDHDPCRAARMRISRTRSISMTPSPSGDLPAVSFVKPSTFNDGHPSSSRLDLFESFTRRIIEQVKSNEELWEIHRDPGHDRRRRRLLQLRLYPAGRLFRRRNPHPDDRGVEIFARRSRVA